MYRSILPVFIGIILSVHAFALKPIEPDSGKLDSSKDRRLRLIPSPAFGLEPETGFFFGALVLFTLRLYDDSVTRTSNGKFEIDYTQKNQILIESEWNLMFKEDKYILNGENSYKKFPDFFYGIGNNTLEADSELYSYNRINLYNAFLYKLYDHWFIGIQYRYDRMFNVEIEAGSMLDTGLIVGANGSTTSGIGYIINWDSRDNLLNASEGSYFWYSSTFFTSGLGSSFPFTNHWIDARKYFSTVKDQVLALHLMGQFNTNDPPFNMLALMGSSRDMRGYYKGRFRDRQYITFQAEYRVPVWKRFGFVVFGGVGDVAYSLSGFSASTLKPSVGGGLRYKLDKKENVNLRVDFGLGQNGTTGFYISFGEAF